MPPSLKMLGVSPQVSVYIYIDFLPRDGGVLMGLPDDLGSGTQSVFPSFSLKFAELKEVESFKIESI